MATHEFRIWKSKANDEWYWSLVAVRGGESIAIGGEGFSSEYAVRRSIENLKTRVPDAPIVEIESK